MGSINGQHFLNVLCAKREVGQGRGFECDSLSGYTYHYKV